MSFDPGYPDSGSIKITVRYGLSNIFHSLPSPQIWGPRLTSVASCYPPYGIRCGEYQTWGERERPKGPPLNQEGRDPTWEVRVYWSYVLRVVSCLMKLVALWDRSSHITRLSSTRCWTISSARTWVRHQLTKRKIKFWKDINGTWRCGSPLLFE